MIFNLGIVNFGFGKKIKIISCKLIRWKNLSDHQSNAHQPKNEIKANFLNQLKEAIEEVKLAKQGKIKLKTLDELIDSLKAKPSSY